MATHYVYPYTGDDLGAVIISANDGDTIIVMPGTHIISVPDTTTGIPCNKSLLIEGRVDAQGSLPVVEIGHVYRAHQIIEVDNASALLHIKRIVFRYWGVNAQPVGKTYRPLIYYKNALGVQLEQVAIIGPGRNDYSGNWPIGINCDVVGSQGILIRNCTFAQLNIVIRIQSNSGQHIVNDCAFQTINEYISYLLTNQKLTFSYCNFEDCPTPRHYEDSGASATESNTTTHETRMWASEGITQRLYGISTEGWSVGSGVVYAAYGMNRLAFGYYTWSSGEGGSHQGPYVFMLKDVDVAINPFKYKHVYVGAVTVIPNSMLGVNRPFLKWKQGGNWYSSTWDYDDGYTRRDDFLDGRDVPLYKTPLHILHKDLSKDSNWINTITQLSYGPFHEFNATFPYIAWTALGFILVTTHELAWDDLYEKLIQMGFGYLESGDSKLINIGSPDRYDDRLSPYSEFYMGKLGPMHDIGAYGGLTTKPYIQGRPYFEDLLPTTDQTLSNLTSVSIHLKYNPITYIDVDWASIQVEALGFVYTQANPTDVNATLTLTGTIRDVLITLTLVDSIPSDPFIVVFRGTDASGTEADPVIATYYVWEGRGTIDKPFTIDPTMGIAAYAEPGPVPKRWEHCYDKVTVSWAFENESGETIRGVARGEQRTLALDSNPFIQIQNLSGHAADMLLCKFGRERKALTQVLPFAPFLDPFDIVQLLYPTRFYPLNRDRKWVLAELRLSSKTGKLSIKGLESHES